MTTIAYRDGVLAADSRGTSDDNDYVYNCKKLFRKEAWGCPVIIATAGEDAPGMLFVDWYGKDTKPPAVLKDADFTILVLDEDGLWKFDKWCRAEKVEDEFYAIGCGAKAALGALHMGASAVQAVEIACKIDPFTAPPVVSMSL